MPATCWYVYLMLDCPDLPEVKPNGQPEVGGDMGLLRLLTLSDGTLIDNPRWLRSSLDKLRRTQRRLARAIQGKGAFRRFKDELHQEYADLLPVWYAFRDTRARRRAVQWLADNSLIDHDSADRFLDGHPDTALP